MHPFVEVGELENNPSKAPLLSTESKHLTFLGEHLMEHLWQTKPQKNNKLLIIGGAIMLFVSFHMVSIYRAKAQEDFARFVEKRIGIEEIQVEANDGVMILTGIVDCGRKLGFDKPIILRQVG